VDDAEAEDDRVDEVAGFGRTAMATSGDEIRKYSHEEGGEKA
jgi:hypothetical protein